MTAPDPADLRGVPFDRLVGPHQQALLAHCYRMTGSLHDAEDALQETLTRAWRSLDGFEGRSSLRTWLFTIATNSCRRLLEQRARRGLPVDFGPPSDPRLSAGPALEESRWITPFAGDVDDTSPSARYDGKESVELAFIAALQLLPARQRAALLLRDVLGFSARETAGALDSSVASANSALQRARAAVAAGTPARSQQQAFRSAGDGERRRLVQRFIGAWERNDVDALVQLLTDDVEFTMPPWSAWFRGISDVREFLSREPLSPDRRWRGQPVVANGQLACAFWLDAGDGYAAESITVLTIDAGRIRGISAFRSPELFSAFGLSDRR